MRWAIRAAGAGLKVLIAHFIKIKIIKHDYQIGVLARVGI
ncbi:MAG: hypothetical protein HKO68_15075 [Desulfobacterales bacterium]|nr:hypothetical protein [Deltaproteobacteria bacterium]NNL77655.1 hypothetical protein [Desulfobacterales bacterium]